MQPKDLSLEAYKIVCSTYTNPGSWYSCGTPGQACADFHTQKNVYTLLLCTIILYHMYIYMYELCLARIATSKQVILCASMKDVSTAYLYIFSESFLLSYKITTKFVIWKQHRGWQYSFRCLIQQYCSMTHLQNLKKENSQAWVIENWLSEKII